jgi:hypothetical protein
VYNIKGTYSHPWFIRGRKDLTPLIERSGSAGNRFKKNESNAACAAADDDANNESRESEEKEKEPDTTTEKKTSGTSAPAGSFTTKAIMPKMSDSFSFAASLGRNPSSHPLFKNPKGGPTANTNTLAGFLETFKNKPDGTPASNPTSVSRRSDNLSSILSALQKAEAVGSPDTNSPSTTANNGPYLHPEMLLQRMDHRTSNSSQASLLELALKVASNASSAARGSNPSSDISAVEAKKRNRRVSSQQDLTSQGQQILHWQPQQHANSSVDMEALVRNMMAQRAATAAAAAAAAARNTTNQSGFNVSSFGASNNIQSMLRMKNNTMNTASSAYSGSSSEAQLEASRRQMFLEQLRLEEGLQTLMKERIRLEAATILVERERRRLSGAGLL